MTAYAIINVTKMKGSYMDFDRQIEMENDYQDLQDDFYKASQYALTTHGKARVAFLKLRKILSKELKALEKELERL